MFRRVRNCTPQQSLARSLVYGSHEVCPCSSTRSLSRRIQPTLKQQLSELGIQVPSSTLPPSSTTSIFTHPSSSTPTSTCSSSLSFSSSSLCSSAWIHTSLLPQSTASIST